MSSKFPFPIWPTLTAIAIAWQPQGLIAEEVCPRVTVTPRFTYRLLDLGQGLTIPDTAVGRKGKANEVEFSGTDVEAKVVDYGLEDTIPADDLKAAQGTKWDPRATAVEFLTRLMALSREKRVADLFFNASIYPSSNKRTLSGSGQWSDPTSTPIADIMAAMDAMVMRPNHMVLGQEVWTKLAIHPDIISAVQANSGTKGVARADAVAELFGLQKIHIGQAFLNSAKKGQTVAKSRVWGKFCCLYYSEPVSDSRNATAFAFTGEADSRAAGSMEDPTIGIKGGERVRVWETLKEVIAAPDLGYLFSAAVA